MNARRPRGLFAALTASLALTQIAVPRSGSAASSTNALVCTLSPSRQFVAYANDRLLPSALCAYAEQVKREWLWLLDASGQWRDPILIVVRPREPSLAQAPAVSLETFQTDEHLKYQVDCLTPLDEPALLTTVVEALCAEWANRDQPTVRGRGYVTPRMPLWLVQGIAASIQGRGDLLLAVARRSVVAGRPQGAGDLLRIKLLPSDPAERGLVQANAWMFTESLLALPNGARKLQRFLTELGAQKVASNAFWAVYHGDFPRDIALEKWWSLQQVSRTSVVVAENLSARETAQRLDEILPTELDLTNSRPGVPGEREVPITQLWRYDEQPWLLDVLTMKLDRLGELRGRAHPLYRRAIDDYVDALSWLMRKSTVRFRRAVRRAEAERLAAEERSSAIAAYIDQAERVYAPEEFSSVFAGSFRTLDQFQKLENERHSPISDYLDKFDRE
ncbi:MAG TPA: hypothetical protein VL486_02385 [Verrucomicrobiae bacterium]|nr:hypothetical protein [Verrucomicrobiae bacterium]